VRRKAKRRGLTLKKSRERDPRAYNFGTYCLINAKYKWQVYPTNDGGATLDEVEAWLNFEAV
jgi:hypothetical protein